ncbi:MAG TPA: molybdopterin-dependent oxidoreductase [Candidatus Deferrimicrobium sp.]|nr:molybdopterin-dependent oxidoreductase [Candidatus Deferrimicrobium sp.]
MKGATNHLKKFTCPMCNSGCGLLIEVEKNRVLTVKPDKNHPLSKGYCCPKGLALGALTNDKDRVIRPLKRVGNDFSQISWKQALHEIADRLEKIRKRYSPNAIAYYMGTNMLHHYAHTLFATGFMSGLGSEMVYNAASVDNNNHFVAQHFLYGSPIVMPIPDLPNTDLFIIIGSNPVVTHLSLVMCSNVQKVMKGILKRGGEIYVIDPRRNETAKLLADEAHHIPILPDTDIFMLLAMINIIFKNQLEDRAFLEKNTLNSQALKDMVIDFTPELAEKVCDVPAAKISELTSKFANTKRACIYGRMGICASTFSTLNAWAIEVLNIITGKLDQPGGKIFGNNFVNVAKIGGLIGLGSYDTRRSRVGNYPEVMGALPLGTLAREILAAKNPVKALLISAGNPILSSPNSNEFKQALKKLELCVVLDFYLNETALHAADYILPVRTPLENSNFHAIYNLNYQLFPHIEYAEAIVSPESHGPKAEWEILLSLIKLMHLTAFGNNLFNTIIKGYERIYKRFNPEILVKILLILGQFLNKRIPYLSTNALTIKKLKKKGIILFGQNEYGVLKKYLLTKNKKIPLMLPEIADQIKICKEILPVRIESIETLKAQDNQFFIIGRRSLKTSNSWLHNIEPLWPKKQVPKLLINPQDATHLNLQDDEVVILENELGSVKLPIEITADIMPKVVCYPHGWGHENPKLSFANQHPGENINQLTNSHRLDNLCGMPVFNGYRVKLFKP